MIRYIGLFNFISMVDFVFAVAFARWCCRLDLDQELLVSAVP